MKFLIDENMSGPRIGARLKAFGHDPILTGDVGLFSAPDPQVLAYAIGHALPVLTRDSDDFKDLHHLIITADGHHCGILMVRFDRDPSHDLTERGIATALTKLESSGVPIRDQVHFLNQWR